MTEDQSEKPPIFLALLISLVLPIICAFFNLIEMYVVIDMGVSSADWGLGYWLLMSAGL